MENRMKKLEASLIKMTTQNEVLTKRLDDLEARHSKHFIKSNSLKSFSTINNISTECDIIEDINSNIIHNKTAPEFKSNPLNELLSVEFTEWKKDIEKCIEKLSEKVAANHANSSNILLNLLETRINDMSNEMTKLKKGFDENFVENSDLIRKSMQKFERAEKLVNELMNHMTNMKSNNLKWQNDFKKDLNDFSEKILNQEKIIEQYDLFDKNINNKVDTIGADLKNIKGEFNKSISALEGKLNNKIDSLDESFQFISSENVRINNKIKEETTKMEGKLNNFNNILVHTKALWDSFALLSSNIEYKC
jgi:hypothetical protein